MYKIAILYIALGKYDLFWEDFHSSCECHFLNGMPKEYYVFTDSAGIAAQKHVHLIPVENHCWPRNTLDRFSFFDKITGALSESDFCFFFNANTLFLKNILPDEVLPYSEQDYLVNLSWHIYDDKKLSDLPYDRNPLSTACIPDGEGSKYYQGGLFGARTKEFLELKEVMARNIAEDYRDNIIAIQNDESHLNRYLVDKKPLCLSTYYGRPQEWDFPKNPAIIFRKKEDMLGLMYIFKLKDKPFVYLVRQIKSKIKQLFCFK
ncbi:MAG: hypothetical protein M0P26_02760 [Bacteroidales bacterium]|nr:hypothetical protein [Bacteroidales bacterium]